MIIKTGKTNRGFGLIEFNDRYDTACELQKSSLASENAIWLGVAKAEPKIMASEIIEGGVGWANYPIPDNVHISTRMHLTQDDVKALLPALQHFAETGELPTPPAAP